MKCAIYARVSTDDKGQDPLNQLIQLREFAQQQGWVIVAEYVDEVSAKNGDRDGFKRMWMDVARHRFEVLLFWSLDRLTREGTLATLQYLRRLKDNSIGFKSYTEQYIDSMGLFSDAIVGIIAAMAQQERVRISDRTKAGIARAKAQGKTWKRGIDPKACSKTTLWRRARTARLAAASMQESKKRRLGRVAMPAQAEASNDDLSSGIVARDEKLSF